MARCWTYETSCLLGREIPEELPPNLYYDYYAPGHTLNRSWCRETSNLNMRNRRGALPLEDRRSLKCSAPEQPTTCPAAFGPRSCISTHKHATSASWCCTLFGAPEV